MSRLFTMMCLSIITLNQIQAQSDTDLIPTQQDDIEIEVHIIGFGVDAEAEKQLREMAAAAGGQYYSSTDNDDLTAVLGAAAGVQITGQSTESQMSKITAEKEPNNRAEVATCIYPSGKVTGKLGKHDKDYYIVEVDKAGEWRVDLSQVPNGLQLNLGVHPAIGGSWLRNQGRENEKNFIVDLPLAGQYVLEVREKNSKSSTEDYLLDTSYVPVRDALEEPNNRVETAFPIIADRPIRGSILPKGDVDYYIFDAPQAGEWSIVIENQPPNHQIELGVYPAYGGSWYPDRSEKGDNKLVVDLPRSGRYILKVNEVNSKRSVSGYDLGTVFVPSPDTYEPNNKAEIASTVPGTGEIVATVLPKGDHDYYSFKTDKAGEWSISIKTQPKNHQIGLGVYPANGGSWLTDRSEKGDNKLVVDLPSPGRYILRATEKNSKRSVSPYKLNAVFTPSPDRYEPNNKPGIAKMISENGTVVASILPKGDYDHYAIDVTAPGRWSIAIDEQAQNMHIELGVYPAAGGSWLRDISEAGDNKLVVDLLSPGRYILRAIEKNGKRSVSPYRLKMQFQ